MQEKKRIALITTWFPPHYGVATNRMLAFAEYLSDTYEVEVFALDEHVHEHLWKNSIRVHYASPNRLFSRLKSNRNDGRIVHHFKTLLRVLLSKVVSNPLRKWQQLATQQLMKRHEEQAFDVLISSFSPHEAHLVALAFCRQFPGIPWIADMRDEMSFNLNHSAATNAEMRRIEQQINQYASAVTSVSAPILSEYKKHLPDVPIAEEIRNGFNHELQFEDATDSRSVFQFGYFGSFYGDIKPDHFFRALNLVPQQEGYEVHIFGAFANFSIPAGLKERVHMHMSLPYEEAIRAMNRMDANIVIHPTSQRKGVYTGKLFDYISARKPVLALMDENDVAAELIHAFNCGYVCDNADIEGIKRCITALREDKRSGTVRMASDVNIATLHRSNGVMKLKVLIERVLHESTTSRV